MSWKSDLRNLLHWPDDLNFYHGKHFLLGDTAQCSALPLLVYSMQTFEKVVFVCFEESPLHYELVCKKMGGTSDKIVWLDMSSEPLLKTEELWQKLKQKHIAGHTVIVDSLFHVQANNSVFEVSEMIRNIRSELGESGVLVTRIHCDTFEEHVKWMVYESDVLLFCKEVAQSDITGRISLTTRGQKEAHELSFALTNDGKVSFTRI